MKCVNCDLGASKLRGITNVINMGNVTKQRKNRRKVEGQVTSSILFLITMRKKGSEKIC